MATARDFPMLFKSGGIWSNCTIVLLLPRLAASYRKRDYCPPQTSNTVPARRFAEMLRTNQSSAQLQSRRRDSDTVLLTFNLVACRGLCVCVRQFHPYQQSSVGIVSPAANGVSTLQSWPEREAIMGRKKARGHREGTELAVTKRRPNL